MSPPSSCLSLSIAYHVVLKERSGTRRQTTRIHQPEPCSFQPREHSYGIPLPWPSSPSRALSLMGRCHRGTTGLFGEGASRYQWKLSIIWDHFGHALLYLHCWRFSSRWWLDAAPVRSVRLVKAWKLFARVPKLHAIRL